MSIVFWIFWVIEIVVVTWWVTDEMKLTRQQPNVLAFLSFLYVLSALLIRYGLHATGISNVMVLLPGIPLVLVMLPVIIHAICGGRWN